MTNGSISTMDMDTTKLLTFLNEFRALECAVCDTVFGFQQKSTGALICTGGCHERDYAAAMNQEIQRLATTATTNSVSVQTPSLAFAAPSPRAQLAINQAQLVIDQVQLAIDQARQEVLAPKMLKPITEVSSTQPILPRTKTSAYVVGPKGKSRQEIKSPVSAAPVVEEPKPKPGPPEPWFAKWKDCKYSPNLLKPNAELRVNYIWYGSNRLLVNASKDNDALEKFHEYVRWYARSGRRMVNKPKIGQVVIAEYEGEYYRGVVIKIQDDIFTVTFVDYGDKKDCIQKELIEVEASLINHPIYSFDVELENVTALPDPSFQLEDLIYDNNKYELDLADKGCLKPEGEGPRAYRGILRFVAACGGGTLNEKLRKEFNC